VTSVFIRFDGWRGVLNFSFAPFLAWLFTAIHRAGITEKDFWFPDDDEENSPRGERRRKINAMRISHSGIYFTSRVLPLVPASYLRCARWCSTTFYHHECVHLTWFARRSPPFALYLSPSLFLFLNFITPICQDFRPLGKRWNFSRYDTSCIGNAAS